MLSRRAFLNLVVTSAGSFLILRLGGGRAFAMPIPGGTLDPLAVPKYATPLLIISDGSPSGPSISGFCVHSVRPVVGSMASIRPKPFGTYSIPST